MKDLELLQSTINYYRSRVMEELSRHGSFFRSDYFRKPSKFQTFKRRVVNAFSRIHDAYLVLIGRAEIEEDD